MRVHGDVDLSTEHVLQAALTEARARRPSHPVVDASGMGFCPTRAMALLVDAPGQPAASRTRYVLGAVQPHVER